MAERAVERLAPSSPAHPSPQLEQAGSERLGAPVDEAEVQPVADAEPVEAGLDDRVRALGRRVGVDVEHAAALRVGERADAVLGGEPRERRSRLPAAAEDRRAGRAAACETSSRAPSRSAERTRPTAPSGRPAASSAGRSTSSTSTVTVRERGAAGPQERRVQALQELAGDVEGDAGPGLEVRADGADRDAPLAHAQAVGQRPGGRLALERLDLGRLGELGGERLDASRRRGAAGRACPRRAGRTRPPRRPRSHARIAARRSSHQRRRHAAAHPRRRRPSARRQRVVRRPRLLLDLLAESSLHFVYSHPDAGSDPLRIERG